MPLSRLTFWCLKQSQRLFDSNTKVRFTCKLVRLRIIQPNLLRRSLSWDRFVERRIFCAAVTDAKFAACCIGGTTSCWSKQDRNSKSTLHARSSSGGSWSLEEQWWAIQCWVCIQQNDKSSSSRSKLQFGRMRPVLRIGSILGHKSIPTLRLKDLLHIPRKPLCSFHIQVEHIMPKVLWEPEATSSLTRPTWERFFSQDVLTAKRSRQ